MSNVRGSSLSSLSVSGSSGAASGDYDDDDEVKLARGSGVPSVGADGGGGGSDRMVALLERLVSRVERLEEKGPQSRLVRDRPPTPAPPAASSGSASLGLGLRDAVSHHTGSHSMASFLSGGGARRIAPRTASAPVDLVDNDSDDDQNDSAPGPSVAPQATSSAAREHPLFMPLAPSIIHDVGKDGFQAWMRNEAPKEGWKKLRNRNECEVLAQVLDALVVDGDTDAAIEILARRFVGVHRSDQSGNWHFADVLAKDMPKRTLLRPAVLSCVLREAKNLTLLESGGYRAPSGSGSGSGSGGRTQSSRGGDRDGGDRQFGRDDRGGDRRGRGDFRARDGRSAQPYSQTGGDRRDGGGDRRQNFNSNSNSNAASSSSASGSAAAGSSQGAGRGGNGQ